MPIFVGIEMCSAPKATKYWKIENCNGLFFIYIITTQCTQTNILFVKFVGTSAAGNLVSECVEGETSRLLQYYRKVLYVRYFWCTVFVAPINFSICVLSALYIILNTIDKSTRDTYYQVHIKIYVLPY